MFEPHTNHTVKLSIYASKGAIEAMRRAYRAWTAFEIPYAMTLYVGNVTKDTSHVSRSDISLYTSVKTKHNMHSSDKM